MNTFGVVLTASLIMVIVVLVLLLVSNAVDSNTFSSALSELTNDFDSVLFVDIDRNRSKEFRANPNVDPEVRNIIKDDFFGGLVFMAENVVVEDNRENVLHNFSKEEMLERLNDEPYYYVIYSVELPNGKASHYETKIMRYGNWPKSHKVIVGGRCIDERVDEESKVRIHLEDSVAARTLELKEKNERLNRINDDIISFLGDIVEARDVESGEHVRRVRGFTHILTEQLMADYPEYGLTPEDVELITSASALHDLGKIMIPDSILLKPGKLTPEEFEIMKTHSLKGCEILHQAPKDWSEAYLKTSMDIVKYHHEKYDGKGYPEGLIGEQIPISAQLVSIVDCYDALINKRCYKEAYSFDDAFNMIINGECGAFSDKILSSFKKCKERFELHATDRTSDYRTNEVPTVSNDSLADMRILLVEDDELTRETTASILEGSGAVVTPAGSGEEVFNIFTSAPKDSFDAILMDVYLPDMDGFEATKKIRDSKAPGADTVPVIAVSASHEDANIRNATEAGMNAYLFKPISVAQVSKALMNCIKSQSFELKKKLTKTSRVANRDPLTGVRSMAAYTDKVEELKAYIEAKQRGFALVECDINGLKQVNDTYGHDIGDVYIVNSCRAICNVFKHSPVYRIGGDEFVAVLQGLDYDEREELMTKLHDLVDELMKNPDAIHGRVSLAAGLAEFIPEEDKTVGDVLKRADTSMYNNKKMMHMTLKDI